MVEQPSGTVTLVLTDIEGSTRLLSDLGQDDYLAALVEHRRVVREAFVAQGGYEVDYEGDAFLYAFQSAGSAVAAVERAMGGLEEGPMRVRVGIHTGGPGLDPPKYVGIDVHLAARMTAAGHGGQVLLTRSTAELVARQLKPLGEHRLKDFTEPVAIFQLGSERFPPLRTISNTNLPRPASSFVGRVREVAELRSLVRGDARLLTLSGPAGSGKTRLAIEAASALVGEFKAGVFWVGLAPVREAALVSETIAQTLGAKEELAGWIRERELLLLLDNLEQVIGVAPALAGLVEACPNLHLLVTSRERLRVRGEVDYPVLPLADPDGVALFTARAEVEATGVVRDLCRRLDNLPLALELAAARTAVLTPAQILERLSQRLDLFTGGRDADPRQQTLRATIEWSHDLLGAAEKLLFARLGVFHGGATLEGAEDVVEAELDTLQSLVDKNLLRRNGDRFGMLETIREYASQTLESSGEAERLRDRHARWFLEFARTAQAGLESSAQRDWLERLDAELPNLRVALSHLSAQARTEEELDLTACLHLFWVARSYFADSRPRLEQATDEHVAPAPVRAKALRVAALLAGLQGDYATGKRLGEQALALYESLSDLRGLGRTLTDLAEVTSQVDGIPKAVERLERARVCAAEAADDLYVAHATVNLSDMAIRQGALEQGANWAEEAARVAAAIGEGFAESLALGNLGLALLRLGRLDEAAAALRDALRHPSLYDMFKVGTIATALPLVADRAGLKTAATLLGAVERAEAELESPLQPAEAAIRAETDARLRAELDAAAFTAAFDQGRELALADALELAIDGLR